MSLNAQREVFSNSLPPGAVSHFIDKARVEARIRAEALKVKKAQDIALLQEAREQRGIEEAIPPIGLNDEDGVVPRPRTSLEDGDSGTVWESPLESDADIFAATGIDPTPANGIYWGSFEGLGYLDDRLMTPADRRAERVLREEAFTDYAATAIDLRE